MLLFLVLMLVLMQVAAQDLAMGVKFSAACTMEIQEYPQGIPDGLCAVEGNWDNYFPQPWGGSSSSNSTTSTSAIASSMDAEVWRDISFSAVDGDFQVGWVCWLAVHQDRRLDGT